MADDNVNALVIHRAMTGHKPMETCDDCPQPITDRTIREVEWQRELGTSSAIARAAMTNERRG